MIKFLRRYWFEAAVLLLFFVKHFFVLFLPLFTFYNAGSCDDLLMVNIADSLIRLKWPDSVLYLTKGIGFPLFLLLGFLTGFGYTVLNSFFYAFSSLLVVLALKPLIRKKWVMLISFALLLFMPVSFSGEVFQRLYRNSITAWQVMLILGSLIAMLLRLRKPFRTLFYWSLPGIIGLSWFYHTREDAIWCLPFAVGMFLVSLGFLCYHYGLKSVEFRYRSVVLALPLLGLVVSIEIISAFNYHVNGFWGTTFFSNRNFSAMVKAIYSINLPDDSNLPIATQARIAVKRQVLHQLYRYSPTLNRFRSHIEQNLDQWAACQSSAYKKDHPDFKEVENGWIFWSMSQWFPGSVVQSNQYFKKTAREVNAAIEQGYLQTRFVIPVTLMAPFIPSAYPILKQAFYNIVKMTLTNSCFYVVDSRCDDNLQGLRYMEDYIGNKITHTSDMKNYSWKFQKRSIRAAKRIITLYSWLAVPLDILGGISAIFLIIAMMIYKSEKLFQTVIFLCGIAASYFILVFGVAYTETTGFDAIRIGYLCGCYPLIMIFNLTALFTALQFLLCLRFRYRKSKCRSNSRIARQDVLSGQD